MCLGLQAAIAAQTQYGVVILGEKSAMGDRTHRRILANNFQLFLKIVISY